IARGVYDATAYRTVQRRLAELLAEQGARLDGEYFCPHHPEFTGPCECRKPGVKLFRDAEAALGLNLRRSYWVGDRVSDLSPALASPRNASRLRPAPRRRRPPPRPPRRAGPSPWATRCATPSPAATSCSVPRIPTHRSGGSRATPARPSRSTSRPMAASATALP